MEQLAGTHNPLLVRRGGRENKKCREASFFERPGWSLSSHVSECILATWFVSDHPVCAKKVASQHFLKWRSHPSSRGGD